eukprot:g3261.t1
MSSKEGDAPVVEQLIAAIRSVNAGSPVSHRVDVLELCARALAPVAAHGLRGSGGDQQTFYTESATRIASRAPRPVHIGMGNLGDGAYNAHADAAKAAGMSQSDVEQTVRDVQKEAEASEKMLRLRTETGVREGHRRTCERVLIRVLSRMEIFKTLGKDEIMQIVKKSRRRRFNSGEVMVTQGEVGKEFMAITMGGATVFQNGQQIAELGVKEYIGERCLIDDSGTHRRAATVLAVGDTTVMVLTKDALQSAGLGENSQQAVNRAADRRYTQLIKQDELRALGIKADADRGGGKKSGKRPASHKIEYTVDFIAPPIGLVLEGKFHCLIVRGFETEKAKGQAGEAVSTIRVGDSLVGVNGIMFKKRETHKQRMSVIQGERWPLRLLFQRVVAGPGPPPPSEAPGFEFPDPVASVEGKVQVGEHSAPIVTVQKEGKSDSSTSLSKTDGHLEEIIEIDEDALLDEPSQTSSLGQGGEGSEEKESKSGGDGAAAAASGQKRKDAKVRPAGTIDADY